MLTASQGLTQLYNKDTKTYTPSWAASPYMVVTPEAFVAGTTSSVMSRVTGAKWTINGAAPSEYGASAASAAPYALTIKENMADVTALNLQFSGTYTDPDTALQTPIKAVLTLNKVETGTSTPVLVIQQPGGMDFINDAPASLECQALFMRNGAEDTSGVTYKWYKQEASGSWTALTNAGGFTGTTTKTLTVTRDAVLNFLNLRVDVTDTETGSATKGKAFSAYCSLRDASDPVSVVVTSTTGDKIVNGTGSTTLTAELWRAGAEIDAEGTQYTYTWYKHKKDGTADTAWGTSGKKTGKTLTVPAADVDVKTTFVVEASK